MNALYTAQATATGEGREGHVTSSDGIVDVDLAVPVEMGGRGGAANPEMLLAAGFSACFHNALRLVARRAKADLGASTVTADVRIGADGAGGYGLAVALHVSAPTVPADQLQELVAIADRVCPFSNAVRGNVEVDIRLDAAQVG